MLFPCELHVFNCEVRLDSSGGVYRLQLVGTEVEGEHYQEHEPYSELMFVCRCQSQRSEVLFTEPVFPVPVTSPSGIGDR